MECPRQTRELRAGNYSTFSLLLPYKAFELSYPIYRCPAASKLPIRGNTTLGHPILYSRAHPLRIRDGVALTSGPQGLPVALTPEQSKAKRKPSNCSRPKPSKAKQRKPSSSRAPTKNGWGPCGRGGGRSKDQCAHACRGGGGSPARARERGGKPVWPSASKRKLWSAHNGSIDAGAAWQSARRPRARLRPVRSAERSCAQSWSNAGCVP